MDLGLAGAVVLVTGGTDGLGSALADLLVSEGARVAVCGRDAARAQATEERLRAAGGDAVAVAADVTVLADLERFVATAVDRWGRLDGVVNNAGKAVSATVADMSDRAWVDDFELKVLGAARLARLALPHLRAGGGGSIVNVLAISAKAPWAGSLPTSASRAAGLALTKSLSKEVAPDNIRVNAVLVGQVESGQWRRMAETRGASLEEMYRTMGAAIPLGRVGQAEEFADLAAYLLSRRSSYVTGSAINLDGGSRPVW